MSDWIKVISRIQERNQEINNKLNPNKIEINRIKSYTRVINERINYIEFISLLAHENIIDFETGQKLINVQKDWLKEDIECVKQYLRFE